jgi:hypothetical protein
LIKSLRGSSTSKSSETKRVVVEATASFQVGEGLPRRHDEILAAIQQEVQVLSGQHVMKSSLSVSALWLSCRAPVSLLR